MTVVVRAPSGKILVLCKGADSVVLGRLAPGTANVRKTEEFLEGYSREGLRTLLIASREVPGAEYEAWNFEY